MQHLGDYAISVASFKDLDLVLKRFTSSEFKTLADRQKSERVNHALLNLIREEEVGQFLLPPVIGFINKIHELEILQGYTLSTFELWLNQFSGISREENYAVRGKITGKYVPRDEYQVLFPVGMGKSLPGSHYVTAHSSPDLDTTVASFWGWVDAFAARVCDGLHLWNVPGGLPASVEVDLLFPQMFGKKCFAYLAKTRSVLALSSIDLMSQKGVIKKRLEDSIQSIDHESVYNAVVVVGDSGAYLGDWRGIDAEGVRQVVVMLNQVLHWFETTLHVKLISLFAQESLSSKELSDFLVGFFAAHIASAEPARALSHLQRCQLNGYLTKVLKLEQGIDATFEQFSVAMEHNGIVAFQKFIQLAQGVATQELFSSGGVLSEKRGVIFNYLEQVIRAIDEAIRDVRSYEERLEIALGIKTHVLGYPSQVISYRAEVEEIRSKMGSHAYLTVTAPDREGVEYPVGVIHAGDLHKNTLGTVSLRDFANREETKIPSYLEVVSIIDHHKTALATMATPVVYITDSQSSNALVAELAFVINDAYSTGGMQVEEIEGQMNLVSRDLSSPKQKRILQRLLNKHTVATKAGGFYVAPEREFIEYLHFLYAIFDDTDLLTKVTRKDLECVASLVNRMKSLAQREEVEVLDFDEIPRDAGFNPAAAARILQNVEVYSLYQKIYVAKERAVEENLVLAGKGKPSGIFLDTKEQNGCCRIGQTKMFARNLPTYQKLSGNIRSLWLEESQAVHKERPEVDLYLQMVSTIAGAEDVYRGSGGVYAHQDELWIWIPPKESGIEHLKGFLNGFKDCPAIGVGSFEAEFLGSNAEELRQIFRESFTPLPMKVSAQEKLPLVVLRFKAGLLNSRKAMISPYLPRI